MLDADAAFKASFLSYVSSSILLSRIVNDGAENSIIGTSPETGGDGSSSRTPPKPSHDHLRARSEHVVACSRLLELARVALLRASRELISCASSVTSYSGMPLVLSCVPTQALIDGTYLDDTGEDEDFDATDNEDLNMLTGGKLFGTSLPPLLTTAHFSVSVSSASRAARINVASVRKAVDNSRLLQAEAGIALDRFSEAVLALSEGKVVNRDRPQSSPPGSARTKKGLSIIERETENAFRRPLQSAKKHGGLNASASSPSIRRDADAVGVISAARKTANAQRKSDRAGVEDAEMMEKRRTGLKLYIEQRRAQRLAIQALGTDEDVQRARESVRLVDETTSSESIPFSGEDERNVLSALATILAAKGEESAGVEDGSVSSLNSSFSAALATLSASLSSSAAIAAESAKSVFAVEKMTSPPGYRAAVAAAGGSVQTGSVSGSLSLSAIKPPPGTKDAVRAAQIALKKTPHTRKSNVSELLSTVAGSLAKTVASATRDGLHVFNTPAMRRHTSAHRTVAMERKGIDTADSYIRKFKSHMAEEGLEKNETGTDGQGSVLVGKKVLEIAMKRAASNEPTVKVTGTETIKDHKALVHHLHVRTWDDALEDGTVSMILNAWAFEFLVSHHRHPTPEERAVKQDELQHEHAVKPHLEADSSLAAKTLLRRSASVGYEIIHPIVEDQEEIDKLGSEAHRVKTVDHNLLPPTSSSLSKGLKVWDEVMSSPSLSVADLTLMSPVQANTLRGFSARSPFVSSSSSSSSAAPPPLPPASASRGLSLLTEAHLLSAQKAPVIDTVTGQPVTDPLSLVQASSSSKPKVIVPWIAPSPWNSGTVHEKEKLKAPSYQSKRKTPSNATRSVSETQLEATTSPHKHLNPRPTTGLVETTTSLANNDTVDVPVLKVNLTSPASSPVTSPTAEPPITTHLPFGAEHGHVHVAHTSQEARNEHVLTRKSSNHSFAAAGMSGAVIAGALGVGSLTTFGKGKSLVSTMSNASLLVSPRRLILHKMKASAIHARASAAAATAKILSPSKLASPKFKSIKSPNVHSKGASALKASIIRGGGVKKTTDVIEPTSTVAPPSALLALAAQSVETMMDAIES